MDGSRVTQGLDFLWFYTNVFTRSTHHPLPSLTDDHCSSPSLHNPNTPFLAESITPRCPKCGEIISSASKEEDERVMHGGSSEMKSGKETKKRGRRKRRKKWNKSGMNDGKRVSGFFKLQDDESYEYEMVKTMLPPFGDDVAMKQHLKLWAYAVACTVK